jgi:hypothetical protein
MFQQRRSVLGQTSGHLKVVRMLSEDRLRVVCKCGRRKTILQSNFQRTKSCGCLKRELISLKKTIHGHKRKYSTSPEYVAFMGMHRRCRNSSTNPDYDNYAKRGIRVCRRWSGKHGFLRFLADMDLKPSPSLMLDRRNNNQGYSKSNCRWTDSHTQRMNQRPRVKKPKQEIAALAA